MMPTKYKLPTPEECHCTKLDSFLKTIGAKMMAMGAYENFTLYFDVKFIPHGIMEGVYKALTESGWSFEMQSENRVLAIWPRKENV